MNARTRPTNFAPTPEQASAIEQIRRRFHGGNKVVRLAGYAGTGKTTIINATIDLLGLRHFDPDAYRAKSGKRCGGGAAFIAPTNKAAHVMTSKGTKATTIHAALYHVAVAPESEIRTKEQEIEAAKKLGDQVRLFELRAQLDELARPRWVRNPEPPVESADLLVADEASMMNTSIAADVLALRKPTVLIGDPGQLPPVEGESFFGQEPPDIMLSRVLRQAAGNPILQLATMARNGEQIGYGDFGGGVFKARSGEPTAQTLLGLDRIICGTHHTRFWLTKMLKEAAGLPSLYPTGNCGEKIVCRSNHRELGLFNGMELQLFDVKDHPRDPSIFLARVVSEGGAVIDSHLRFCRFAYFDHHLADGIRQRGSRVTSAALRAAREEMRCGTYRRREDTTSIVDSDWAWAITCHVSQGSEWERVAVFDESFAFRRRPGEGPEHEGRERKWLYTALTRAAKELQIYG